MTDFGEVRHDSADTSTTSRRFNLANDSIGSHDFWIEVPTGTHRFISLPAPTTRQRQLRKPLEEDGLILGHRRASEAAATETYSIPASARPLAYEAPVTREGAYSYTDEELFHDLGDILGSLSHKYGDDPQMVATDVTRVLALVDFVQPGERQVYFTPGVERLLVPRPPEVSAEGQYAEQLETVFSGRFDEVAIYFRMGFAEAAAAARGE